MHAVNDSPSNRLQVLPPTSDLLQHSGVRPLIAEQGRDVVMGWIRDALADVRRGLLAGETHGDRRKLTDTVAERVAHRAERARRNKFGRLINATGVILHTGLGRAPLSKASQTAVAELAGAGNVEIDLETGERRHRGYQLNSAWHTLSGAEDSLVVNNNAAATLLTLQALCQGKEVIISRGQLIEIGGSFRLPEIFKLSGARLREVGTTNRTKLSDYEQGIGPETAAIMHVHPSNYRVIGFTEEPRIDELARVAHAHALITIDDIGSGSLIDLTKYGLPAEPTFSESVALGADVVLGSGDKLLGGPQCGIILGKSEFVQRIRRHPLARAVRIGKLTLAALSETLGSYLRSEAESEIPTIAMLAVQGGTLLKRARAIEEKIGETQQLAIQVSEATAPVGGGSLPGAEMPTAVLSLQHQAVSSDELARSLRLGRIRVFCRIQQDKVLVDLRSVQSEDDSRIVLALRLIDGQENIDLV